MSLVDKLEQFCCVFFVFLGITQRVYSLGYFLINRIFTVY
ncbi:hypothetical protein yrohd0001_23840 [Yersinia rohdei ATCC 43380]|nr:hypothetical protein yrohd0001_23840 [Yersinia rohdei ATCC 43380]